MLEAMPVMHGSLGRRYRLRRDPGDGVAPGARLSHDGVSRVASRTGISPGLDDADLISGAVDGHEDDPEFGYRLSADELIHARGSRVGEPSATPMLLAAICSRILKGRASGNRAGAACMTTTSIGNSPRTRSS